jgi:hypothetical protein
MNIILKMLIQSKGDLHKVVNEALFLYMSHNRKYIGYLNLRFNQYIGFLIKFELIYYSSILHVDLGWKITTWPQCNQIRCCNGRRNLHPL